ncbi:hypothetical protein LPTSP4_01310 [Leptospira ryugenii]|uniref:Uncharacterized protein n=1 Tax=Leptospira ryugenii TaxID=1917863 RepID=A0A2P2DVG4_9LEPT|nr:hypothetical protein LPTSP4_01310 [Leptospira ryugenii]
MAADTNRAETNSAESCLQCRVCNHKAKKGKRKENPKTKGNNKSMELSYLTVQKLKGQSMGNM